jgi:hypothetical protein
MKKVKTRADKDQYGELVFGTDNIPSEQYMRPLLQDWEREYSKAFNIFKLVKEDLNKEFTSLDGDRLKLMGQLDQKLMMVQHVDTGRWYRLPTKDVVKGIELTYGERYMENGKWVRDEQSLLVSDI